MLFVFCRRCCFFGEHGEHSDGWVVASERLFLYIVVFFAHHLILGGTPDLVLTDVRFVSFLWCLLCKIRVSREQSCIETA